MRSATLLLALILLALPTAVLAAESPSLVFVHADENGGRAVTAAGLHLVAEIPGGYLGLLTPADLGRLTSWDVSHEVILSKAEAIVAYRDENGQFKHADELVNVKGIGLRTVDINRDYILLDNDKLAASK